MVVNHEDEPWRMRLEYLSWNYSRLSRKKNFWFRAWMTHKMWLSDDDCRSEKKTFIFHHTSAMSFSDVRFTRASLRSAFDVAGDNENTGARKKTFSHVLSHLRCLVSVFVMRNFSPSSLYPKCLRWSGGGQWEQTERTSVVVEWKIIGDTWDSLADDCALLQFATNRNERKSQASTSLKCLQTELVMFTECLRHK